MVMTQISYPKKLVIASRESRLAMWQAEYVRDCLKNLYPGCDVSILGMTTRGDQILDRTLSKVGGKGLFVKELEVALEKGEADLAVHSLKDVPMQLPEGFDLACIMEREDARDAFVSNDYDTLADLPPGSVVGTASLRREASLRARYPHLEIRPLRGNLDTRLGKLDQGEYAAIILAAAGLKRLGLASRIRSLLAVEDSLPAAGQGALGIEIRAGRADMHAWLAPLNHAPSQMSVGAERAVSRALGGSCDVPLAAYAVWEGSQNLYLRAFVASVDGAQICRAEKKLALDTVEAADAMGLAVADDLIAQGAMALLPPR
jgi:hydroxymethylbilane synthase